MSSAQQATNEDSKPRELLVFAELFACAGLAITQPALDLLGKNPGILVAYQANALTVVAVALLFALAPATVLYCVGRVIGLFNDAARSRTHRVFIGVLIGIFALETIKQTGVLGSSQTALLLVAGASGALVAWFVDRGLVRAVLHALAFAPIAFLALFLVFSPASDFLRPGDTTRSGAAEVQTPACVVMVVLDELPLASLLDGSGAVDADMYPNIAKLAATSTWYRNTSSVSPFTNTAVPAILTGQYPHDVNAHPSADDYPESLFRLLGRRYEMNIHETMTDLCPDDLCDRANSASGILKSVWGVSRATRDLWVDFASPSEARGGWYTQFERPSLHRLSDVERFVESLQASDEPRLDFLHITLPHQPWVHMPDLKDIGRNRDVSFIVENEERWQSDKAARLAKTRHLLQLQATDLLLGQITDRLQAIRGWDDSLVVLTADHGAVFVGGQTQRRATDGTVWELMWVPFFVKAPEQRAPVIDDRHAQTVDVVPTIADLLGAKIPWPVDGISVHRDRRPEGARPFYQWSVPGFDPEGAPIAENGKFLAFDGADNFAKVIRSRAVPASAEAVPPGLRPFQLGPFGSLVGKTVGDLSLLPSSRFQLRLENSDALKDVATEEQRAPWLWQQGGMFGSSEVASIAFALNGRIAGIGLYTPDRDPKSPGHVYAILAPKFFRDGNNELAAYQITGGSTPRLQPVTMR